MDSTRTQNKGKVLLAGGSGFVGKRLAVMLRERGYEVRLLSRRADPAKHIFGWDTKTGTMDDAAVREADFVVNLAGEGVAEKRWTAARKQAIVESRVQSAQLLRGAFERTGHRPKAYISASAIGIYGDSGEKIRHEADPPDSRSFLAKTCVAWEKASDSVAAMGIRTVVLRIGVVLGREAGALAEIVKPLGFGLGTYFADGQAWYSWIHRDDLCRMIVWAIENEQVAGVFNAVAPNPARNLDLTKAAAKAMRQPAVFLPAPAFALRLVLGEMSAVVLDSIRVSAEKVMRAGFQFQFPELRPALDDIFKQ